MTDFYEFSHRNQFNKNFIKGLKLMKYRKSIIATVIMALISSFIIPKMPVNAEEAGEKTDTNIESNNYNYGEALQKSILFYEFQRSGKLPEDKRDNWKADSGLEDGADVGLDLTGGWYDAGDFVKFNLPMSYSATMLAWSVYEDKDAYEKSGQLTYMMNAIKWADDYFIKCHPEKDVYYYQVGNAEKDHKWWGPSEVMQMERPAYKVDKDNPGSCVCADTAAALASAAIIFKDSDEEYSELCLKHARELFEFADETKSDKGYTEADGYYKVNSGYWDELTWAATWLYMATNESDYLNKAEDYVSHWGREQQTDIIGYKWAQCWDDVHYGTQILLAKLTNKDFYKESCERNLDWWTTGYDEGYGVQRIQYTDKGLAFLSSWGALRYAETMAFLAGVYAEWEGCPADKSKIYTEFMDSQVNYALGSTGRSFLTGYGVNPPEHIHHREAQASWLDDKKVPGYHRHNLVGALVGGPLSTSDNYEDNVENFNCNEPACDYNAGFVGALAKAYKKYGGDPIENLRCDEEPTNDEYYVNAAVNASGNNFIEIKAVLYNDSGWPAKVGDKLSFKYFIDLSELYDAGYTVNDVKISTNYNDGAKMSELLPWDEDKHIYYVIGDFSGRKIYPGGQSQHRAEVQFRLAGPENTNFWDNSNDYSYEEVEKTPGSTPLKTAKIPVYDDGKLVFGVEPEKKVKVLAGDINGDGTVDVSDYTLFRRYLNNGMTGIKIDEAAADVNADGGINFFDLVALKNLI